MLSILFERLVWGITLVPDVGSSISTDES